MKHVRVPIGDGAVDKAVVLIHSKSVPFKPINPADYEKVLKENEQLKETNGILIEQINVNHALIMVIIVSLLLSNNMSYASSSVHIFNCRKCILILEKNHLKSCCAPRKS